MPIFIVLCAVTAAAQTTISLDAAIRHALQNNIELHRRTSEIRKSQALLDESSRPPNPLLSYLREDLTLTAARLGEWIAVGSLPLNFLWERWSNIESKQKSFEAQKMLLGHSSREVIHQVQAAYSQSHYYTLLSAELDSALTALDEIGSIAKQRASDGDISEYELQRILIAVTKLRSDVKTAELHRNASLSQLRLLTGLEVEAEFRLAPLPEADSIPPTRDALLKSALRGRKDLKAIDLLIESESAFLTHSRLKSVPTLHVAAGYKKQLDQFAGSVLQFNVEIPLFRRNQAEIETSEAELSILERQKEALVRQIVTEAKDAFTQFRQYELLRARQFDHQVHNIFSTAVYSYKQGVLSLVEFIDGLNAYTEGMKLRHELEMKYRLSFYELMRVSGGSLIHENN